MTNKRDKIFCSFVTKNVYSLFEYTDSFLKSLVTEGILRCKSKAFKCFKLSVSKTKHKHQNILWGRSPSPSYLHGR